MQGNPFQYSPVAVSHVYWRDKKAFQLSSDTYSQWVLFAVTAGRFRYCIGEQNGEAGVGDVVYCPPMTRFVREVLEPVSFHFYTFHWQCTGDMSAVASEPRPSGRITYTDLVRLNSTYAYLEQVQAFEEEARLLSIETLFKDLWHQHAVESLLASATAAGLDRDKLMSEAARWMQQHAYKPLRLKDYSASLKLSPVQFTRRFQAAWGKTPIDYITSLRIEKAKLLLLETRLPLDDIAAKCGYENGFYLSRMFKKRMKISPSQFRAMHSL